MRRICSSVILIVALSLLGAKPLSGQDGTGHVVRPGDNVYHLALRYGVSVAALMEANGLTSPHVLIVGQVLTVPDDALPAPALELPPGARLHTVQPGENLLRIAQYYGLTPEAVMRANALQDLDQVAPGQQLIILADEPSDDLGLLSAAPNQPSSSGDRPPEMPARAPVEIPPPADEPADATAPEPVAVVPASEETVEAEPPASSVPGAGDPSLDTPDLGILPAEVPVAAQEAARLAPPAAAPSAAEPPAAMETEPEGPAPVSPGDQEAARIAVAPRPAAKPKSKAIPGENTSARADPASPDPDAQVLDMGILAAGAPAWLLQPGLVMPGSPATVREIFARGQRLGNNPRAFSKIGDCNSEPPFFLARFEGTGYDLGPFAGLQFVIDHFAGSFARPSMAAWTGAHAWAVFDPTWSNPAYCAAGESPIACEFRVQRPSVALIALGTNEAYTPALFEEHLRHIVEYSIEQGVIPVLGTKADQLEGGDQINTIIRDLAEEYGVPLWDFGRAAESLPGRGLQADGFHLTYVEPYYSRPAALQSGHAVHNLTALLALDAVWRSVLREAG